MGDLLEWLRAETVHWAPDPAGLLVRSPSLRWPVVAEDFDQLVGHLKSGDALAPLPTEPAALANVIEQAILAQLHERLDALAASGLSVHRATAGERHYPDLEVSGEHFSRDGGYAYHAVDIKVAKTRPRKRGARTKTQSRPTLYTGNTYFKYPDIHTAGILRPFGEYDSHLDIIVLYDHHPDRSPPLENIEVVVHPAWKIASTKRSSTTREYIGAVDDLQALRAGTGEFDSEEDFYKYWRTYAFATSQQVMNQLIRERRTDRDRYEA